MAYVILRQLNIKKVFSCLKTSYDPFVTLKKSHNLILK